MLYSILRPLIKLTIRLFFRNFQVNGLENIPKKGPFIFAANHPATFMDGIIIAATFMVNAPLGIATALAVFAHEVPQEIGDFGLMLHFGLSKKKIILVNVLSAAVSFIGALLTYFLGGSLEKNVPVFLGITAGFFIYIALSDLIPEIHYEKRKGFAFIESALLLVGIIVIWIFVSLLE